MTKTIALGLTWWMLALGGCTNGGEPPPPPPDPTTATLFVGLSGATIELGRVSLEIPPGALAEAVEITITREEPVALGDFTALSPVYRFEPDGLRFLSPAVIRIPFEGDEASATVFWTADGVEGWAARETEVVDGMAVASVTHFSRGFVGRLCDPTAACCGRARSELDMLITMDNSNSWRYLGDAFREELATVIETVATGDVDGDGDQDFPIVERLQLGVVTTDMGTGGHLVPTCDPPDFGDDGILRTEGDPMDRTCDGVYPSILTHTTGPGSDPSALTHAVGCISWWGAGCGFEQPFEAALKALTPSTSDITFHEGTPGHGDGANAGLLRPGSVLAVMQLIDENDCSSAVPELFDPSSPEYTGDLNLRCFEHADALHPVDRYIGGLLALRRHPSQLIYAALAGIPADLIPDRGPIDYDAILRDPRMEERIDPDPEVRRLAPVCTGPSGGMAFPGRRQVELARDLQARGAAGLLASACSADLSPLARRLVETIARRLSGRCD